MRTFVFYNLKKELAGEIFVEKKRFWDNNFSRAQKLIFGRNFLWGPNIFGGPKYFWGSEIFWESIFSFSFEPKYLGPKFICGQKQIYWP